MKINWKVRLKNVTFWTTIIPMILVLVHQVLKLCGIDFEYTELSEQLVSIAETVFMILGIIGITNDPTTKGISDSQRALNYDEPN